MAVLNFKPGDLVRLREREWVVLPELSDDLLKLRPLGGSELDATLVYLPIEPKQPVPATFNLPNPEQSGSSVAALLLRDALRLKLRAGAGPFRSFGNLNFEPRTYQLVPLLMALKLSPTRLLIADDVGIGKTIEAGMIARELVDRGEIERFSVICPPHLCDQWQRELAEKFNFDVEVVRPGTVRRLERGLRQDESIFEAFPYTVVSLDYIKSDRRRAEFLRTCSSFIIVDEAHTCVSGNPNTRHQRYQLLKGLAQSEPLRSVILLTATPHSGNDTAFHNLLALLNPNFGDLMELPSGDERQSLRDELALHFVQRRRADIKEWEQQRLFPIRESRERTYTLTGNWGALFSEVLAYARTMVQRAEGETDLKQRMSWWAVLALLRCISSSPAAAYMALRTRLKAASGETKQEQLNNLDQSGRDAVMDEVEDALMITESTPAGTVERIEDSRILSQLIDRAKMLRGPKMDPKLSALIKEVRALVQDKFKPVIFCRYIATAHYVEEYLKSALPAKTTHVLAVTGELDSSQREAEIEQLGELSDDVLPVLVATDCLSEGINLQNYFNAVIHYDLAWNPTRHEQREGRADRYGQASIVVRTLMLYGENNPIDGAILRVILRKADQIRKELGVHVPLPVENDKLLDTLMKAALFQGTVSSSLPTLFEEAEEEMDIAWEKVKQTTQSRTLFAQRSLKPAAVLPEWKKTQSVLGGSQDVERFVRSLANRLGVQLNEQEGYFRFPAQYLPKPLQDRLNEIGFKATTKIAFSKPDMGVTHVHGTHPLVSILADYVVEQALESDHPEVGARCSAIFTEDVTERTVLYLLRLRFQLHLERRGRDDKFELFKSLLAEECLGVSIQGPHQPKILRNEDAFKLLSVKPSRNMQSGQKSFLIQQTIDSIEDIEPIFNQIALEQSKELFEDHRRIRDASGIKGLRYRVEPCLPVDKIGIYVFMPSVNI